MDMNMFRGYVNDTLIAEISTIETLSIHDRYIMLCYFKIFSQKSEEERWSVIENFFHEHEKEIVCYSSRCYKGQCFKLDILSEKVKQMIHPYLKLRPKNKIRHEIKQHKLDGLVSTLAEKYNFETKQFMNNNEYTQFIYNRIYQMIIDDLHDQENGKVVWVNDDEKIEKSDWGHFEYSSPLNDIYTSRKGSDISEYKLSDECKYIKFDKIIKSIPLNENKALTQ